MVPLVREYRCFDLSRWSERFAGFVFFSQVFIAWKIERTCQSVVKNGVVLVGGSLVETLALRTRLRV